MIVLLLVCLSAVAVCGSVRPFLQPPSERGWIEPADYAFTLESRCGERDLIGTFRVAVRNHETVEFHGLDESGKAFPGDAASIPTLAGILNEAEEATSRHASSVKVETDPVDGHPMNVAIDWKANAIDDEACYRVSDYTLADPGSD
jgi:hypothetical protein